MQGLTLGREFLPNSHFFLLLSHRAWKILELIPKKEKKRKTEDREKGKVGIFFPPKFIWIFRKYFLFSPNSFGFFHKLLWIFLPIFGGLFLHSF